MKSLEELKAIRDRMQAQVNLREASEDAVRVVVGMATCGIAAGARPVLSAFVEGVQEKELKNVSVVQTGCVGLCQFEPIVEIVTPSGEKVTYINMTADKAAEVIDQHLVKGKPVAKYTLTPDKLGQ